MPQVLTEALLMSTHNICLHGEIRKNIYFFYLVLWASQKNMILIWFEYSLTLKSLSKIVIDNSLNLFKIKRKLNLAFLLKLKLRKN